MEISGTSKHISKNIIKYLIETKYINKTNKGYVKTPVPFRNPIKKLVAIEVKLKDWKQGILQARRYKSYTDECYLAILSKYGKNIDPVYIDKIGIGLILFNEKNGDILIKSKPRKNEVLSFYEEAMGLYAKELFIHHALAQNLPTISFQV